MEEHIKDINKVHPETAIKFADATDSDQANLELASDEDFSDPIVRRLNASQPRGLTYDEMGAWLITGVLPKRFAEDTI